MMKALSSTVTVFLFICLLVIQYTLPIPSHYALMAAFIFFVFNVIIIIKSTDYMVGSIAQYTDKLRIPAFLVGFVIISATTTFPDISAGFFASLAGHGDLILGDVVMAVMVDIGLLTALAALILRKIPTNKHEMGGIFAWGIVLLMLIPFIFGFDGKFSRFEGIVLILIFGCYTLALVLREVRLSHIVKKIPLKDIWKEIIIFDVALAIILLASRYLVVSATYIAQRFHLSPFIIGLFFVALGTSLPEILFQIKAARSGVIDIGFGNSLGSLLVDTFLVTGIAAVVRPFEFPRFTFLFSYLFMMVVVISVILLFKRRFITWKHGIFILSLFILFLIVNLILGLTS